MVLFCLRFSPIPGVSSRPHVDGLDKLVVLLSQKHLGHVRLSLGGVHQGFVLVELVHERSLSIMSCPPLTMRMVALATFISVRISRQFRAFW